MELFLEIVRKPAIIIAIVACVGLIASRQKITSVISGTIVAFVGFTMIKLGSSVLSGVLAVFATLFQDAFHTTGLVPSNEAMMAGMLADYGSTASLVLVVGLVSNILIARFTRFKAVYLSLHLALFTAFAVTAVMTKGGLPAWVIILVGGVVLGLYMAVSPFVIARYTRDVVGTDEYTIAHSGTTAYFLGSFLASKLGNKERDAEDVEVSDRVLFLKDPNVATMITMFLLFFVAALASGQWNVPLEDGAKENFVLLALEEGAKFAGGLFIVKAGIKLFIDEIVPAFKGFAKIFAPGAIPGVDVLVLFDRSPNTALIGFLTSFATGVVFMLLLPLVGLPVIVPGLMACFITGGAAAILGNAEGGLRGAVIASVVDGLLLSCLPAVGSKMFAFLGVPGSTFADPDMVLTAGLMWLCVVAVPGLLGIKAAAANAKAMVAARVAAAAAV